MRPNRAGICVGVPYPRVFGFGTRTVLSKRTGKGGDAEMFDLGVAEQPKFMTIGALNPSGACPSVMGELGIRFALPGEVGKRIAPLGKDRADMGNRGDDVR